MRSRRGDDCARFSFHPYIDDCSPTGQIATRTYRLKICWTPCVISLDGEPSEIEKRKLHSLLESGFKLDPGTADQLIASATRVEGEAVDLYHFTSVIMRSVNDEGRLRIVEMMWELVYADGQVTEFEDNVVWRAADLLGVSSRDRIELKHRVAAANQPAPIAGA
jgi:uncharacterized tellurite resistance protein B-like protein